MKYQDNYYVTASDAPKEGPNLRTLLSQRKEHWQRRNWESFDLLFSVMSSAWEIQGLTKDSYLTAVCSCVDNQKHNLCKHTLGLAIRLGFCKPPSEAKNVKIGQKRKKGRPAKAKHALIRD